MSKVISKEKGIIKLCGECQSCPEVDLTDPDIVLIRDDFGGQVKLTRWQWGEMKRIFFAGE